MNQESSPIAMELDGTLLSVKKTKDWLSNLPQTDSRKSIESMVAGLKALADSNVDLAKHLRILNCYHSLVAAITSEIRDHHASLSLPLPQRVVKSVAKTNELYGLLADQYIHLAAPVIDYNKFSGGLSNRHLADACYWGISYLSEMLRSCYESYLPPPSGLWTKIHRLYLLARNNDLLQHKLVNGSTRTIDRAYKRALLLSLSDPYQLPFRTVDRLFELLDFWSTEALLQTYSHKNDGKSLFVVDLQRDDPGLPYFAHTRLAKTDNCLLLDTASLVEHLNRLLQQTLDEAASEQSDVARSNKFETMEMLRTLIVHWGTHPIRQTERRESHKECDLVVGLKSVNYVVNDYKPFFEDKALSKFDATYEVVRGTFGYQQQRSRNNYVWYHHWRYMDESSRGLHLILEQADSVQVEVGDFVAVRSTADGNGWQSGIVRWAKIGKQNKLELGIYKVGGCIRAAAAKRVSSEEELGQEMFTPAIVFPGTQKTFSKHSAVAKSGVYQPNGTFWLNISGEDHVVQANNLIISTRSVDWFEFTYEYEKAGISHPPAKLHQGYSLEG